MRGCYVGLRRRRTGWRFETRGTEKNDIVKYISVYMLQLWTRASPTTFS